MTPQPPKPALNPSIVLGDFSDRLRRTLRDFIELEGQIYRLQEDVSALSGHQAVALLAARTGPRGKKLPSQEELAFRASQFLQWQLLVTSAATKWRKGMRRPWSQEACAEALGVTDGPEISRWLSGKKNSPKIEKGLAAAISEMKKRGIVAAVALK